MKHVNPETKKIFQISADFEDQPCDFRERMANRATSKRGRPRYFKKRTDDQATSKRGWPRDFEDLLLLQSCRF